MFTLNKTQFATFSFSARAKAYGQLKNAFYQQAQNLSTQVTTLSSVVHLLAKMTTCAPMSLYFHYFLKFLLPENSSGTAVAVTFSNDRALIRTLIGEPEQLSPARS